MLASMCRITVILDFRSQLKAYGVTYGHGVDGRISGIAVPKKYPSRGRGIESKRKGRHGSPMRSKMQLKSWAAGYARR